MIFKGSAVALITPFKENGEIDFYSLRELIEYQIANGTKAIVILGTTGESSTISGTEREKIIKFCVSVISKRVPVIVGTGSNNTKTTIKLSKQAEANGADGLLIVSPYYNKCNQNGVYLHYKAVAESVKTPIILYNVPPRTGVNILPETVKRLSKIKNIVGIKEASGNIGQIQKILSIVPKSFAVYSGDDNLNLALFALGAMGTISVTANCYPEKVSLVSDYALSGDFHNAKIISRHLEKINEALFFDVNPICVKFYLHLMGLASESLRLPLCKPNKETQKKLLEVFDYYEN